MSQTSVFLGELWLCNPIDGFKLNQYREFQVILPMRIILWSILWTTSSTDYPVGYWIVHLLKSTLKNKGVFVVLLELSAAFDTIDHDIPFTRLESIGVKGHALGWLKSYLYNRSQAVNMNGMLSSKSSLHFGVPQGSVLGPILFNICSSPIANIARNHGLLVQAYADDTQLYIPFKLNNPSDKISAL